MSDEEPLYPSEIPEAWRKEPRADLGDLRQLNSKPELDSACLRLAFLVLSRTRPGEKCCRASRAALLSVGWSASKLDRHRHHLLDLGLLEEVRRPGRVTLRRINPRRAAELAYDTWVRWTWGDHWRPEGEGEG